MYSLGWSLSIRLTVTRAPSVRSFLQTLVDQQIARVVKPMNVTVNRSREVGVESRMWVNTIRLAADPGRFRVWECDLSVNLGHRRRHFDNHAGLPYFFLSASKPYHTTDEERDGQRDQDQRGRIALARDRQILLGLGKLLATLRQGGLQFPPAGFDLLP